MLLIIFMLAIYTHVHNLLAVFKQNINSLSFLLMYPLVPNPTP